MSISVEDLKIIVGRGGGVILDARQISVEDLKIIAGRAKKYGALVTLKKPHAISSEDLKVIAGRSEGSVVFDFYDG